MNSNVFCYARNTLKNPLTRFINMKVIGKHADDGNISVFVNKPLHKLRSAHTALERILTDIR